MIMSLHLEHIIVAGFSPDRCKEQRVAAGAAVYASSAISHHYQGLIVETNDK